MNLLISETKFIENWDYDKNIDLDPTLLTVKSKNKAYWVCKNNHSVYSYVFSYCSGVKCRECCKEGFDVLKEAPIHKSLKNLYPEIAREWNKDRNNGLKPEQFYPGSSKKVWWKCFKGHEWEQTIEKRVSRLESCPVCRNRLLLPGVNDLKTMKPELLKDWDWNKNAFDPDEVKFNSSTEINWVCHKCSYEWKTPLYNRTRGLNKNSKRKSSNCLQCSQRVSQGELEINAFINQLGYRTVMNTREIIPPKELDIYIPDLRKAIEFNGDYWHSDQVIRKNRKIAANFYHEQKLSECEDKGVTLVYVWQSQWETSEERFRKLLQKFLTEDIVHSDLLKLSI